MAPLTRGFAQAHPVLVGTVFNFSDGDAIKVRLTSSPINVRFDSFDAPCATNLTLSKPKPPSRDSLTASLRFNVLRKCVKDAKENGGSSAYAVGLTIRQAIAIELRTG